MMLLLADVELHGRRRALNRTCACAHILVWARFVGRDHRVLWYCLQSHSCKPNEMTILIRVCLVPIDRMLVSMGICS